MFNYFKRKKTEKKRVTYLESLSARERVVVMTRVELGDYAHANPSSYRKVFAEGLIKLSSTLSIKDETKLKTLDLVVTFLLEDKLGYMRPVWDKTSRGPGILSVSHSAGRYLDTYQGMINLLKSNDIEKLVSFNADYIVKVMNREMELPY